MLETHHQPIRLRDIADINEDIKRIVNISYSISLSALNAMLLVKRAGQSAVGFGVVSTELRTFSQRLEARMGALSGLVQSLVAGVAHLSKQTNMLRYLETASAGGDNLAHLGPVLATRRGELAAGYGAYERSRQSLVQQLDQARKLCAMGGVTARAAKIEAAHSHAFKAELQHVSLEAEQTITGIMDIVKRLHDRLA